MSTPIYVMHVYGCVSTMTTPFIDESQILAVETDWEAQYTALGAYESLEEKFAIQADEWDAGKTNGAVTNTDNIPF